MQRYHGAEGAKSVALLFFQAQMGAVGQAESLVNAIDHALLLVYVRVHLPLLAGRSNDLALGVQRAVIISVSKLQHGLGLGLIKEVDGG